MGFHPFGLGVSLSFCLSPFVTVVEVVGNGEGLNFVVNIVGDASVCGNVITSIGLMLIMGFMVMGIKSCLVFSDIFGVSVLLIGIMSALFDSVWEGIGTEVASVLNSVFSIEI